MSDNFHAPLTNEDLDACAEHAIKPYKEEIQRLQAALRECYQHTDYTNCDEQVAQTVREALRGKVAEGDEPEVTWCWAGQFSCPRCGPGCERAELAVVEGIDGVDFELIEGDEDFDSFFSLRREPRQGEKIRCGRCGNTGVAVRTEHHIWDSWEHSSREYTDMIKKLKADGEEEAAQMLWNLGRESSKYGVCPNCIWQFEERTIGYDDSDERARASRQFCSVCRTEWRFRDAP